MKILIIENEIYLAQSIASKLSELGYSCETVSSTKDALKHDDFDVVLLSTNINGQDFYPVIEKFASAIVILMVSYISNDTVSKPLKHGAKDYILKPFMIEELIRKIEHYQEFERLRHQNETYEKYLNHAFESVDFSVDIDEVELPIFISSSYQKYADSFAFKYASVHNKTLHFLSMASPKALQQLQSFSKNAVVYITDFEALKRSDKESFLELIKERDAIVASASTIEDIPHRVIEIKNENSILDEGEILPIEDYVKYIVLNYQHKFPDTELSKKLGISRKSLWEKRKKYGIIKKK